VRDISRDPDNDLAILHVNASDLKPIQLADSSIIYLGQRVYAIGTPFGEYTNTVTAGIISGLHRGVTATALYDEVTKRLEDLIQT